MERTTGVTRVLGASVTVQFTCDGPGCSVVMSERQLRLAVHVFEPLLEPITDELTDEPRELPAWEEYRDRHFHSTACLVEWAFARQLEEHSGANPRP